MNGRLVAYAGEVAPRSIQRVDETQVLGVVDDAYDCDRGRCTMRRSPTTGSPAFAEAPQDSYRAELWYYYPTISSTARLDSQARKVNSELDELPTVQATSVDVAPSSSIPEGRVRRSISRGYA
jgi:hypothetical protein